MQLEKLNPHLNQREKTPKLYKNIISIYLLDKNSLLITSTLYLRIDAIFNIIAPS